MSNRILISAPYLIPFIGRFMPFFVENGCEVIVAEVTERLEEDELLEYLEDIDAVICGDDRFSERVLKKAKRLKVISKWGTGIDSIDQEACGKFGIAVRNTQNAFTVPVSDTVLAYILNFTRNISAMTTAMKRGDWKKIDGRAMHECSLGVIGVGNIGESVLRKASAFGMRLYGNDIKMIPTDLVIELGICQVELEELLEKSDFVSINCDLNEGSRHLINGKTLKLMQAHSVLINTARGPIVDERALIQALSKKEIGGACLDVFEEEPLPLDSALFGMENVFLAPHNSNSSPFAWEFVHINTINNVMESLGINARL